MTSMVYTEKIQRAIKFAAKTHNHYQQQTRKGKVIPYISHPLTAGIILSLIGASEDVVAAGILHDTIEDSVESKKVTPAMIAERFGEQVKDLVVSVTETDRTLPWAERKALALEHITHFSPDMVLVKSADVLSNGTELVDDYRREGIAVFDRFRASASDTMANYERLIAALLLRFPESPLADDLHALAADLVLLKNDREQKILGTTSL
jgi:(p)ppGpp synthase/HD superfamily hydrolase